MEFRLYTATFIVVFVAYLWLGDIQHAVWPMDLADLIWKGFLFCYKKRGLIACIGGIAAIWLLVTARKKTGS